MDYNLENKILLSEESEYKSLYSWSLQEFDKENKNVGLNQVPWPWSLYFTASELRYHYSIDINKLEENEIDENATPNQEKESITAILHSGTCIDGKSLEDEVIYSMFGTNRLLNRFNLQIHKIKEDKKEVCYMWGSVSYTSENDLKVITQDDTVLVELGLSPQRFDKIAELIKGQRVDILEIRLSQVSGFYSEWSPSISTSSIKILTASKDHKVIIQDGCKIDPPRLGYVGEFNMSVIQRHKLNPKQDLRSINIEKLFEQSGDHDEDDVDEKHEPQESQRQDKSSLILSQLARNEVVLKKLSTPIWLIFIFLCFLLIKFLL